MEPTEMSSWVKVTFAKLESDQLRFVAELVKTLQINWQVMGLVAPVEAEASFAPELVLFAPVEPEDRDESVAAARKAVAGGLGQVQQLLAIGPDGYDPVNTNHTVSPDQLSFDGGYRRIGQVFVRNRPGVLGRLASELEVPAQVVRGAIWSVARGTSSRVIIPNPPNLQVSLRAKTGDEEVAESQQS
jgi:hypothetical protein